MWSAWLCGLLSVSAVPFGQLQPGATKFDPLLPPSQRIERGDIMHPLVMRSPPQKSDIVGPSADLDVSISPMPSPQPVVPGVVTIGNCIDHRTYLDYPERLQIVFPGIQFPGDGTISEWQVYAGRDCELEVQVFRPLPTPKALDENKHTVHNFDLVGRNFVSVPALGNYTFSIPDSDRIHVAKGDVIGFYTSFPGCVSWSDGGPQTLHRYNKAGHNEVKAFGGTVFIGDGLHRTYSIAAVGHFEVAPHEILSRVSPSSSPSVTPIVASVSSSHSPSGSVSVTPVQTPSVSSSPRPSESMSTSTSFSPSVTPTVFSKESECARGIVFWCANERNMQLCNVTAAQCEAIYRAMHPILPSPIPSHSGSLTPSVSLTPTFAFKVPTQRPSVTPSMSLVVAPYLEPPPPPAGLSNCNYCLGGTDWGGLCTSGTQQSPIEIKFDEVTTGNAMDLYFSVRYNYTRAQIVWNDYAFVISPKGSKFGQINVDGINYDADLAFIRAPSEHQLQGSRTPMEMQIYHQRRGSNPPVVLAVSILFEEFPEDNSDLDWIYAIPEDKSPLPVVVDLEQYLSDLRPLTFYNGSFTQPPCTEGVTWAVSMQPSRVGYNQMLALNKFLRGDKMFANGRGNNRALQTRNGRQLLLRSNCGMEGANMDCGGEGAKARADTVPVEEGGAADEGLFGDDDGVKLW